MVLSTTMVPRVSRRLLLAAAAGTAVGGAAACGDRSRSPDQAGPISAGTVVQLRVAGKRFRPRVELRDGSRAAVRWIDLDTRRRLGSGPSPELHIAGTRRVGMTVRAHGRSALHQVVTLDLGFDHRDDTGRYDIGSAYDLDPQPVTGISGLRHLTGLVRFCAARTHLVGTLDLRGLSRLEHVECYGASIDAVRLAGCSHLVRLCVENCRLSHLNLNPVRGTLRDLRAAIQRSDGLTFTPLRGPMRVLYHYCVRDQVVRHPIPHRQLPAVEQYWVFGSRQRSCDAPTSPVLRSYLADDNPLDQASVDRILVGLHSRVAGTPGRVDIAGRSPIGSPAAPSRAGHAAAARLQAAGWRVSTNRAT